MREIKFRAWNPNTRIMILNVQNMYDGMGEWCDQQGRSINPYQQIETTSFGGILASAENGEIALMQFTGLKDKSGVAELYEGDIVDGNGNLKGNIYENHKEETDLVIQGFGASAWEATNKEAMARGCKYSE